MLKLPPITPVLKGAHERDATGHQDLSHGYLTKKDAELSEINPGSPRFKLMSGVVKVIMNLFIKQKESHRCRKQIYDQKGMGEGSDKLRDWN